MPVTSLNTGGLSGTAKKPVVIRGAASHVGLPQDAGIPHQHELKMMKIRDGAMALLRWLLRPNPRRFLAMWYTVWLLLSLKAFVINWLIHHQPIRIAWVPVTGPVETVYLLAEIGIVSVIVRQAWRFDRANWRLAFIYEWYSLMELGLSLLNPKLWTYAINQMWCTPTTIFGHRKLRGVPARARLNGVGDTRRDAS